VKEGKGEGGREDKGWRRKSTAGTCLFDEGGEGVKTTEKRYLIITMTETERKND